VVRGQESEITKCDKKTFGENVDYVFDNLGLSTGTDFKEDYVPYCVKNFAVPNGSN